MAKFDKNLTNRQIEMYQAVQADLAMGKTTSRRLVRLAANAITPLKRSVVLNALVNYNLKHSTFMDLDTIQAVEVADA